mmetsp:Transcript_23839/g.59116  ORF Transcript_23839/g.59116 Transcript_23839/m.59116 type:complete len:225 (-) Transcript_23839:53-727(-)
MSATTTTTSMMMTARSPGVGAERLRASRSRHASGEPLGAAAFKSKTVPRTRAAPQTEARLRPGRQGVQRIYRMTSEKSQVSVYEYLESLGVPRVNALQVQSQASEWFEYENAKAGGAPDAPFGVNEMAEVVEFLEDQGVAFAGIGRLVCAHPPVLAYSVDRRLAPLFAYLAELGLETEAVVANLTRRPNLLGLDPDQNMRKMVDYLMSAGNTQEEALTFLLKTL